jgi:hypothetical protein
MAQADYLLSRIEAVGRSAAGQADRKGKHHRGWQREDREDLILEVAEYLSQALGVPDLERELVARSDIDLITLREVIDQFAELGSRDPSLYTMQFSDGRKYDWESAIEKLRDLVSGLEDPHALEEPEIIFRLGLVGDSQMMELLVALPPTEPIRASLAARLLPKLDLLPDAKAFELWGRMRMEVDPSRETGIPLDPEVVSVDFFVLGEASTARSKVAEYLTRVRPLLLRSMFKTRDRYPIGEFGIASILAWTNTAPTHQWSTAEQIAIRSLGRLSVCWGDDKERLAAALRLPENGYFLGGRAEREAKQALKESDVAPDSIFDELVKLVQIAEQKRRQPEGAVERALVAYKLGKEVMGPSAGSRRELDLQRDLLRFLVERDILAFGTKFGSSETDVRAHDELGALIVEAKVVQTLPSETAVSRWLGQLGQYMDQKHQVALRGALAIYNFSKAPILVPRGLIPGTILGSSDQSVCCWS